MPTRMSLHRRVRRRLQKLDRKTRDADLRVRIRVVLKVAAGLSLRQAAGEVACSPSSAWRIVARFEVKGEAGLIDQRSENGCVKADEDVRAGIRDILTHTPQDFEFGRPTWTLELIARVVEIVLGVTLSRSRLCRLLHEMGVRWGRPRPVVYCPWKAARRRARIKELRNLAEHAGAREPVLYVDEVDIHLNPRIGPDWMLPGEQKIVVTPGQNVKRYLAGALDLRRNRLVVVEGDRKVSWLFLRLVHVLIEVYAWAGTIHLILDNYIIHKSRVVKAAMEAIGAKIQLHFLPPYCPQENKIERVWQDLHGNVTRNHRCPTIEKLMVEVHVYLGSRFDSRHRFAYAA